MTDDEIDLGKVTLGAEIGRGGFGTVYEGFLEQIDSYPVAVKVFDPSPVSYTHLTLPTKA